MSDLGRGSEAVANYITICNTIADSYPEGIAHGLQKDAIQNALDARKGKGLVRVEFKVVKNRRDETFLTFKDSNTTGLTGDVVKNVSDYKTLKRDDHWARFEGFGYTKLTLMRSEQEGKENSFFFAHQINTRCFTIHCETMVSTDSVLQKRPM